MSDVWSAPLGDARPDRRHSPVPKLQYCGHRSKRSYLTSIPSAFAAGAAAANTQPARRHGIFYYVFWGTISLFATLVILFFGFIFLTAAGAGFIRGLSQHAPRIENTATAAQNLPALTDTEAQQAKSLLDELRVKRDDIEGITWYSPEPRDSYKTDVYLYIGQKQVGQPSLRWKIRYFGDGWLFIRRYRIKIDEAEAATLLPTKSLKHETGGDGSVWEIFDEAADQHAHLLNQMLAGNIVYLRMDGTEGHNDIELGAEQLQRMRDVLLVYRYLGGTWPAN
jgi:hypothetical protein